MATLHALSLAQEHLAKHGYAIIPAVFHVSEIGLIKDAALSMAKDYRTQVEMTLNADRKPVPSMFFWPRTVNPILRKYCEHPDLSSVVRHFLGTDVRQILNQFHYRLPNGTDQYAWHQDIVFRPPEDFVQDLNPWFLQTVIVVDPMTGDNGSLEFVPGSHKRHIPELDDIRGMNKFVRGQYKSVKVKANPGDLVLWSLYTVHGSEPNTSSSPRMTYLNGFAAEAAVLDKKKYPVYK